ncbi:MAG: hypothetical protein LBK99_06695 [Opitutaceae bacterium]|jgi:hypothetical protein|nr:hypothetical protein [Opitutaceae bacterium]
MRPFDRNRNLTQTERIRRIGELTAIAVMRYCQLHPEEFTGRSPVALYSGRNVVEKINPNYFISDESENRILDYLSVVGSASPRIFKW